MADDRNPSIWQIVLGGVAVAIATIGSMGTALWAISQTQMSSLKELVAAQTSSLSERLKIVQDAEASNDARLGAELSRRETEIKSQMKGIQDELNIRRKEFLNEREFVQFEGRIIAELAIMKDQLRTLEQTRPTTGELQATTTALRDRIDKLYSQVTSIDEYLRAPRPK